MAETCHKIVENELRTVRCGTGVALESSDKSLMNGQLAMTHENLLGEFDGREFKVCSWSVRQVYQRYCVCQGYSITPCKKLRVYLTWFLRILIDNTYMLISSPSRPPGDPPHLKTFPFLSLKKLSARKYSHQLIAEIIGSFRSFH